MKKVRYGYEGFLQPTKNLKNTQWNRTNDSVYTRIYRNQLGKTFPELHWMCKTSGWQLTCL